MGPTGPTGLKPTFVEHTVFVDKKYGTDAGGQPEDPSFPYATITAAQNAPGVSSGWNIVVYPDTYNEANLGRTDIQLNFYLWDGVVMGSF